MRNGKIRIKTLNKLLRLYNLARDVNRPLTIREAVEELRCSRSNAYNYLRALDRILATILA